MEDFKHSTDTGFALKFVEPDGSAANLTGASVVRFMMKVKEDDADNAALITKNLGSGITVPTPTDGFAIVTLTAAELQNLNLRTVLCEGMAIVGGKVKRTATYVFGVKKPIIKAIA